MAIGKVKWFNNAKGYGFVLTEDGLEDLFAHYSAIQMDGYKTLKAGQDVQFDIEEGPKGLHAVNIQDVDGGQLEPTVELDEIQSADIGVSVDFDIDGANAEATHPAPDASSG
jgi:CspA family cold shock protein